MSGDLQASVIAATRLRQTTSAPTLLACRHALLVLLRAGTTVPSITKWLPAAVPRRQECLLRARPQNLKPASRRVVRGLLSMATAHGWVRRRPVQAATAPGPRHLELGMGRSSIEKGVPLRLEVADRLLVPDNAPRMELVAPLYEGIAKSRLQHASRSGPQAPGR